MEMLTLTHVSKSFGDHTVLEDLSFSVPEHSIFGFIGSNGAGKTTTMKMILGLLKADSGQILVDQRPVTYGQNAASRLIGYLPDVPEFYGFLTPVEYLTLVGRIAKMPEHTIAHRSQELLDLVGLSDVKKRIHGFSRGMKQRLGIAQALLGKPRLLICDEPTSALDPLGRKEILDILSAVKNETTVLFSTHILSDVERICDEIALLHQGKITWNGTLAHLHQQQDAGFQMEFLRPDDLNRFAAGCPGGKIIGKTELLYERKNEKDMLYAIQILAENNIPVRKIEMCEFTLEHLFMKMTGNETA